MFEYCNFFLTLPAGFFGEHFQRITRGDIVTMNDELPFKYKAAEVDAIFNLMADGVFGVDEAGNCTFINKAALKMLGYPRKQCIGKNIWQLIHDQFAGGKGYPEQTCGIIKSLQGKTVKRTKDSFFRSDGSRMLVRYQSSPIVREDAIKGIVVTFNCIGRDTEGSKHDEEQLRLNERRFRHLVQNGADMIAILDELGNYRYVSPTSISVLGTPAENFIGKNAFDFIHPDDVSGVLCQFQRLQHEKHLVIPEFRFSDHRGNWRWLETVISNMTDDPAVGGIVANSRDITDRKQAEMTLRSSEEKYRLLFQYGPLPKWIYDIETLAILDVNTTAIHKYGYSRTEFISMTIKDLRPESEIPNMIKGYEEALSRNQDINHFGVYTHRKKNGDIIKAEIWGHKIEFEGRECMLALVDDVTDRVNTLELLKENEEKLLVATSIAVLGYWQIDLAKGILTWSDEVYQIWGISREKIKPSLGYFMKTMPFSERKPFSKVQAAALRGERELDYEHRVVLPNGVIKWVHEKGRIVKAKDGKPLIFSGTVQDITGKKLLELSLQESNQRYDLVTKATSDIIWDWTITQNTLYLSESFAKIFGYPVNPSLSKISDKHDYIHPEDVKKVIASLQEAVRMKSDFWECEYKLRRSDDTWAFIIDKGLIIKDKKGKPVRVVGAMRDISLQKEKEQQLKLLESVIIQTSDSVMITEAITTDESGPPIIYANEAFMTMTGYSAEELKGRVPGILHGPDTDTAELARLYQALINFQPCEITVINYKKDRQPFWHQFSVNPVRDHAGEVTHWIAIGRDVTMRKRDEIHKALMSTISLIFNESPNVSEACSAMLAELVKKGQLCMAELWLVDSEHEKIKLNAKAYQGKKIADFYTKTELPSTFSRGIGLPGLVWEENKKISWNKHIADPAFIRSNAAIKFGISHVIGIPLGHGDDFMGALVLGLSAQFHSSFGFIEFPAEFSAHISDEIRRKQLEQELDRIFKSSPEVICMMNLKGKFLKINPAGCKMLGWSERGMLELTISSTVHSNDLFKLTSELESLSENRKSMYLELRHVTSDHQERWMAWSLNSFPEEALIFAVAKDITEKKQLELLLEKTNDMARIGSWEIDTINNKTYWSPMIFKLLEFDAVDEAPDLSSALNLYKQGESRDQMAAAVSSALATGKPFDVEVQIVTAKGKVLWVKVMGQPKMADGKCVGLYGNFQDINIRKEAQFALIHALEERNNILESIGDGFFAVNDNWVVTYWNTQAEKLLFTPKEQIVGMKLGEVFSDSAGSLSHQKYREAITEQKVIHFEDWYPPLQRWYALSVYPSAAGLSVYFKDVTESRKAQEKLEEMNDNLLQKTVELAKSEKRYSDLFQLSPQPMWVYDLKSLKFLDVNNAAILHYGYSQEEFLAMTLRDIRPKDDIPLLERSIATIPPRESYISQGTYRHLKKNGEIIQVEIYGNTISYKGFIAEVVFAIDVTERQLYINAIEQQNKKLLDIAWFQSHVMRVPVARILGLSHLLEEEELTTGTKKIIDYMTDSANELDKAIISVTEKIEEVNVPSKQ